MTMTVRMLWRKTMAYATCVKRWLVDVKADTIDEARDIANGPIRAGVLVMLLCFIGFGVWGVFAPLDSAAIAMGTVIVSSNRKTVQHLEGGIIKAILVKEGDAVNKNQPLIILEETSIKANLNVFRKQLLALQAKKARLEAERDLQSSFDFDGNPYNDLDPNEVSKIVSGEQKQFNVRKRLMRGQLAIFDQKVKQFEDEIKAVQSQKEAAEEQLTLIAKEIESQERLLKRGFVSEQEMIELKKKKAELVGQKGAYQATISKAQQAIAETQMDSMTFQNETLNEIVAELQDTQVTISDLEERVKAADDALVRSHILATNSGIVTDLKYHTIGGVIAPGNPIMDIVPQDEELIIEARIQPQDIDVVQIGLVAKVRLSAFKSKTVPMVMGKVIQVSPDRFTDQMTGMPYFTARVKLDETELKSLNGISLYPGMTADVYIVTGARTFIAYLMSPITDTFRKTFKEE
jgi:HlyD family type I secretion membrane fusion protein